MPQLTSELRGRAARRAYAAAVDGPARVPRRSARRLLIGIAAAVVVLAVVFGVTTLRQQVRYREYREATLASPPWRREALPPEACVAFAVDWAMACPGLGSWCENEAPRLVTECMQHGDRSAYCDALGDAVASTDFGVTQCEQMRAGVDGRHLQRAHKKFCAGAVRAVAEHCRARR